MYKQLVNFIGRFRVRHSAGPVYHAPADMTDADRVREMVHWGEEALGGGHRTIVVDLSRLHAMDCSLVAGLVLLGRRAKAVRATIEVVGFPQRFESLLSVYRVLEPLRRAGVRFEGALGG